MREQGIDVGGELRVANLGREVSIERQRALPLVTHRCSAMSFRECRRDARAVDGASVAPAGEIEQVPALPALVERPQVLVG